MFLSAAVPFLWMSASGCDQRDLSTFAAVGEIGASQLPLLETPPEELVELGRLLFWDPVLSGELDVACATCHHPDFGYADGLERSRGVGGRGLGPARSGGPLIDRNAPTVLNTALNGVTEDARSLPSVAPMFWDGRADSLEEQVMGPVHSAAEMRGDVAEDRIVPVVVGRLEAIQEYRQLFDAAFGDDGITGERIAAAIAGFERSLVALNSPFDRYLAGDESAMDAEQLRGMREFADSGCADCHSGPMLSDFELHSLGIGSRRGDGSIDDGAGSGEFKTPSLRNVALTAPYMHDGSQRTLRDVLELYDDISGRGGSSTAFPVDRRARDLRIGRNDFNELQAFLEALTSPSFDRTVPATVPSGLQPGGAISVNGGPGGLGG